MYYYIVFKKEFADSKYGVHCFEWLIYKTPDIDFALQTARKHNEDDFLNIHTERFMVYESEKMLKTYNKKSCKLIYPSVEYPLFY